MTEPTDKQDEDQLEAYLSGESDLSRAYQDASDALPSPSIDTAILAAAREQSATQSQPKSKFLTLWDRPLSIAAVMLLSASLVIYMQAEQDLLPVIGPSTNVELRQDPSLNDTIERQQAADTPPLQRKSGVKSEAGTAISADGVPSTELSSSAAQPASPEPSGSSRTQALEYGGSEPESLSSQPPTPSRPTPDIDVSEPLVETDEEPQRVQAARSERAKDRDESANARPLERQTETITDNRKAEEMLALDSIVVTGNHISAPAGHKREAAETEVLDDAAFFELTERAPQAALEHIAMLWQSGRRKNAVERLAEFQQRYPDYPLTQLEATLPKALLELE